MPYDRTAEAYLRRKQDVPTDLTSREMAELGYQIRERAFWSATVNNAKVVNAMHRACNGFAAGKLSMSDARLAIQRALDSTGYKPADGTRGTIRDLSSFRRQNLILRTNLEMAQGYVRLAEAQEDLDLYPCFELVRIRQSRVPRDWKSRWTAAGGKLYGGRMIAEVNSPIWTKISRFGQPYPPFDFNSGMGLRDVSRKEAVGLGAIGESDFAEPRDDLPSMNESLETEISGADDALKADISERMKGLAKWDGDRLVFTDPNGTRPYSPTEIVEVLNKPLPENFYGDGKSPYHQRDAAVEWANNSSWIKSHPTSDKAYHLGRLVKRITPLDSETPVYRGMSWSRTPDGQKQREKFLSEIESGFYERAPFESYTTSREIAEVFGEKLVDKVIIKVVGHHSAHDISEIIKAYERVHGKEGEILFSGNRRMKIIKREDRIDGIYLTVEEVQ